MVALIGNAVLLTAVGLIIGGVLLLLVAGAATPAALARRTDGFYARRTGSWGGVLLAVGGLLLGLMLQANELSTNGIFCFAGCG